MRDFLYTIFILLLLGCNSDSKDPDVPEPPEFSYAIEMSTESVVEGRAFTIDLVKLGRTLSPYTFKLDWRHIV